MKTFKIPVTWIMMADVEVNADSLDEAIDSTQQQWSELPLEGDYVDDSFETNVDCANEMNDEQGVKPEYQ